jgi:hypothetical protein
MIFVKLMMGGAVPMTFTCPDCDCATTASTTSSNGYLDPSSFVPTLMTILVVLAAALYYMHNKVKELQMRVQALTWEVVTTGDGVMTGLPVVDTGTGGVGSPRGGEADLGHIEANNDEVSGSLWLNQVPMTSNMPFNPQEIRNYNDLIHWLIRRAIASGINPLVKTMSMLPTTFWEDNVNLRNHAYRVWNMHRDMIDQETYKCRYAEKDRYGTETVHFGACKYLLDDDGHKKQSLQKFRLCKVCLRRMWLKDGYSPEKGDTAGSTRA